MVGFLRDRRLVALPFRYLSRIRGQVLTEVANAQTGMFAKESELWPGQPARAPENRERRRGLNADGVGNDGVPVAAIGALSNLNAMKKQVWNAAEPIVVRAAFGLS